jgi:hypothetical protein
VRAALRGAQRAQVDAAQPDLAADLEHALVEQAERGADGEGLARARLADDREAAARARRVAEVADQVRPARLAADLDVEVLHADYLIPGDHVRTAHGVHNIRGHERSPCLRATASAIRLSDTTVSTRATQGMITSRGAW